MMFSTPAISNASDTDRDAVVFVSGGGTISFTSYGRATGDRLTGTLSATLRGERAVKKPDGTTSKEIVTGTMTASFDVKLASY